MNKKELLLRNLKYGNGVYGNNHYPNEPSFNFNTLTEDKILYVKYKQENQGALFLERQMTDNKELYSNFKIYWNIVQDAIGYNIYKGANENSLELYMSVKENYYNEVNLKQNNSYFYKIVPLFKKN
ncbi:MAG: hypothetical protein ACRCW9_01010 [Cetobacterium sp.]